MAATEPRRPSAIALDRLMAVINERTTIQPRERSAIRASLRAYRRAIEAEAAQGAAPLDPRWCHDKECVLLEKGVWGHPVSAHEQWEEAAPRAEGLDWGRLGYVLGLVGPVDMEDTEDAYVAYTEDIRERYERDDLESDPQYADYVARLSRPSDELEQS